MRLRHYAKSSAAPLVDSSQPHYTVGTTEAQEVKGLIQETKLGLRLKGGSQSQRPQSLGPITTELGRAGRQRQEEGRNVPETQDRAAQLCSGQCPTLHFWPSFPSPTLPLPRFLHHLPYLGVREFLLQMPIIFHWFLRRRSSSEPHSREFSGGKEGGWEWGSQDWDDTQWICGKNSADPTGALELRWPLGVVPS